MGGEGSPGGMRIVVTGASGNVGTALTSLPGTLPLTSDSELRIFHTG